MILCFGLNIEPKPRKFFIATYIEKPKLDKKESHLLSNDKIFAAIFILKKLIPTLEWATFLTNLAALIEEYGDILDLSCIGFPEEWYQILENPRTEERD